VSEMSQRTSSSQSEDNRDAFRQLVEQVQDELICATSFLKAFEVLHAGDIYRDVFTRYGEFLQVAREAHRRTFFIAIFNVLDNSAHAPSIYRLLRMIDKYPELAPSLKTKDIRAQIKPFQDVIKRVSQARNQRMARRDTDWTPVRVDWPEPLELLAMCQSVFNQIKSAALQNSVIFDKSPARSQLDSLMQSLMQIEENQTGT